MLDPAPQRQQPLSPSKKRPPRTSHPKKWRAAAAAGGGAAGNDNVSKGSFGLHQRISATATKHIPNNSNDSVATPSSVHVKGGEISLTRDLSDLSGSYMNGNTAVRGYASASRTAVPCNVYPSDASGNSYQRPWRHAKVLSRLPLHPQPHADDESSVGMFHRRNNKPALASKNSSNNNNQEEISVVDRGEEAIEVEVGLTPGGVAVSGMSSAPFKGNNTITTTTTSIDDSLIGLDSTSSHHKHHAAQNPNKRTPIILILMDPQRKKYELMQLWMDAAQDTVRDVLQAVTRNLTDNSSWRQDYDGLFQVRNNHFSQLIHVLVAGKYDVVPGEVWVAKPWSMSAKATVGYASTLLNHLKQIGVLQYARASDFDSKWKQLIGRAKHNGEDTVLVLSKVAQKRVYVPEGILKHHHACQFLSFTPPFEGEDQRVDVLSGATSAGGGAAGATVGVGGASSDEDAASALSDSHYGGSDATMEEPVLLLPTKSQDQTAEEDTKSQAESTYSTTGSGSPSPSPRGRKGIHSLYDADGEDGASMVTRESSYKLKPRSPNAPLPHYLPSSSPQRLGGEPTSPQRGVGIGRFLSALNCKGNKHERESNPRQHLQQHQKDHVASYVSRSNSRLTNVTTPLRRSFEDAEDMQSQCSGAPLLFTQSDTANWTTTVSMQQEISGDTNY